MTLSIACKRTPTSFYALNFSVDGQSPRSLEASRESAVRLTLTNTGQRAWDPQRIHVSYHWLWLIPRELARRSRTVPYQEGIRTNLAAPVASGGGITIDARLLAPALPGVYWLQWDMVEEGVDWFAQVAPRQPRRLVVVWPTPADLFVPLPLLVAIAGLIAFPRFSASDIVWCATSLFSKQVILFSSALLEPTWVAYWLALVFAVMPAAIVATVLPRRGRAPVLFVLGVFGAVLMLGDVVYYRFFGDVLSTPAMLAVRQTGQISESIWSLLRLDTIWLLADLPFALWLTLHVAAEPWPSVPVRTRAMWAACSAGALALAGMSISAPSVLASTRLDQMFRNRLVVEELGGFGFHAYDAWNYLRSTVLRPTSNDAEVEHVASWFLDRAALRAGSPSPFFGKARGRNLIVVQVESLQEFVVDYRVGGQDVMPHLRRWSERAWRFTNVTDQTNEGRTSDGEFVALTSLPPLDHGAVAFRYPANHYVGLPRVLTEHGYATLSAVAFEGGFWNRLVMHPSYGFGRSLFEPDFRMTEQIGWGLNDRDFLQQMVPHLEQLRRPFGAWLITLGLHHPFEGFPDWHKTLKLGALEGTPFGNYLHTMRFFDQALEDFMQSLARDGLLDDSVIAVFGDHDAGFAHDAALAATIGIGSTEADWMMADRVPFLVRAPGVFANATAADHAIGTLAGQTDFAPTLLALLGIDPAPLPYAGRNLLGTPGDPPLLRPYGDWIDREHLFVGRGGHRDVGACYSTATREVVVGSACESASAAAGLARDVLRTVIADDLQARLRTNLARLAP